MLPKSTLKAICMEQLNALNEKELHSIKSAERRKDLHAMPTDHLEIELKYAENEAWKYYISQEIHSRK